MLLSKTIRIFGLAFLLYCIFCYKNISLSNKIAISKNNFSHLPSQALAVGYNLKTFSTNFSLNNVDLNNTSRSGTNWYSWRFFGHRFSNTSRIIKINNDASVTLLGDNNIYSASIATATPTNSSEKFLGTAFGGGAYFEALLKFDSNGHDKRNWPAFWSMAIEHMASLSSAQWPGQPKGYEHFIEADFFEYDVGGGNFFGGAIHDWYGIWNKTCPEGYCKASLPYSVVKRQVPKNTDFNQYHRYGFLWVPATDKTVGYAEYYFDGQKVGERTSWSKYTNQSPPPGSKPWTFGIIDNNHLVIVLGTGFKQPMTVKSVSVWQASIKQNLIHTKSLNKN
jgi:hypothetical protein